MALNATSVAWKQQVLSHCPGGHKKEGKKKRKKIVFGFKLMQFIMASFGLLGPRKIRIHFSPYL